MSSGLIKKYMHFDVDFVDAEDLVNQLSAAICEIKKVHKEHNVNDKNIKACFDSVNKTMNIMYYDLADNTI